MHHDRDIDAILAAYLECALWAELDDDERPLDDTYDADDIDAECVAFARIEIEAFIGRNWVSALAPIDGGQRATDEQIGHDLWLTRNGHGAGFWCREHYRNRDALTRAAEAIGPSDAYAGDDGKVYLS